MTDHKNFGKLENQYATFENAAILLQSIPYDGTSTWGKGADKGFAAFLEASAHNELYDIETDSEVYLNGIHILPEISEKSAPELMVNIIYERTKKLLLLDRFLTFFGGDHSVSIGIIRAYAEKYPDLSVLQMDAHTDLRPEYMDSPYNHACALHEASRYVNLIQVGIRSIDVSEFSYFDRNKCFFAEAIDDNDEWMDRSIEMIGENVYITFDLDVFDPSIMPSTGTPEPGGLDWYTVIKYLKKVFMKKNVLGFDIVELAPIEGTKAPDFLAVKLYYKMLSYKFKYRGK